MTRATLAAFVALALLARASAFAPAASAQDWRRGDAVSDGTCGVSVPPGGRCYYPFTGSTDSEVIEVKAEYSTVCLDPDTTSTGAANAQVRVMCVVGDTAPGSAGDVNNSYPLLDATLTGDASTNLACIYEVPCDRLWIDVTASASGDPAVVLLKGAPR